MQSRAYNEGPGELDMLIGFFIMNGVCICAYAAAANKRRKLASDAFCSFFPCIRLLRHIFVYATKATAEISNTR